MFESILFFVVIDSGKCEQSDLFACFNQMPTFNISDTTDIIGSFCK